MKRIIFHHITLLMLIFILIPNPSYSTVLTFDDIFENPNSSNLIDSAAPGYGGFDWWNLVVSNYVDSDRSHLYTDTGFQNGAVSDGFIAWPNFGGPININSLNGSFDFNGVYITSGYHVGMNVTVGGYLNDQLLYTSTVIANNTEPAWFTFDYYGIDELMFTSFGGTLADPFADRSIDRRYTVIDNFTYNEVAPVPEPTTMLLLGTGLLGLGIFRRKLKDR